MKKLVVVKQNSKSVFNVECKMARLWRIWMCV